MEPSTCDMLCQLGRFQAFYATYLRGSLFTGFLTLGGFLFAVKTFIVIRMKEGLYDHEQYDKLFQHHRRLGGTQSKYAPLSNLSRLLFFAVVFALGTSLLQFTLGLVPRWWAALVCVTAAAMTFVMLFLCLWLVKKNLDDWFACIEEDGRVKAAQ